MKTKEVCIMKKYIKYALIFLALGIACGVFFREFSKAYGVVNEYTTLGVTHVHFLVLGVAFVLLIGLVTEKLGKGESKLLRIAFPVYASGTLGTGIMLVVRGIFDVLSKSPLIDYATPSGANGAIAGVAGIFHAVLGAGLIMIFVAWLLKPKAAPEVTQTAEAPKGSD